MQILITGGAGFIGSTLADKLIENNEIIVVDNFNDFYDVEIKKKNIALALKSKNYKLYNGDICDNSLLQKIFDENNIEIVIHMAARCGVRQSLEAPLDYVDTNIRGTVNILEKMKQFGVKKLVFASSSSVYGNCNAEKFAEDLKISEPISQYAATKLACEQFIYTYSALYDISAVCLRFFTVYGPRQRPDLAINKFVNLIIKDKPIPLYGDGSAMRDYTYVDDVVDGIIKAIDYDKTKYEIINIGGGSPVTLNSLVEILEKTLGKKAQINYLPMQAGDVKKTVSDISKARDLLNYEPKVSFGDGIQKFVEWELAN